MLFSNTTYKVLKQLALVWLPALSALYLGLANLWNLPGDEEVSGSIMLIDTFLGVILGISTAQYNKNGQFDGNYDGEFALEQTEDGTSIMRLKSVDRNALENKDRLTLKLTDIPRQRR